MSGVSRNGHKIRTYTASGYIGWKKWNPSLNPYPCIEGYDNNGDPIWGTCYNGGYDTGSVDATINGTVNATHNNRVFVNGNPICVDGDTVNETATYTLPIGAEKTSGENTGTGTVNASGKVYVNGKAVAKNGSSVSIYAGGNTIINEGSNNVFIN